MASFISVAPVLSRSSLRKNFAGVAVPSRASHGNDLLSRGHVSKSQDHGEIKIGMDSSEKVAAPHGFQAPEPKRFAVRPDKLLGMLFCAASSAARLGSGAFVEGWKGDLKFGQGAFADAPEDEYLFKVGAMKMQEENQIGNRPAKPLEVYEFEACPFCRKVREAISILDLDVYMYPCPQGGEIYRPKAIELGGKKQFPYLVDPNTGVAMYESDEIIKYLFDTYGSGKVPALLNMGGFTTFNLGIASIFRAGRGGRKVPSRRPEQPLTLWAYEASPFSKIVRERLCELELPYLLKTAARGSSKRTVLLNEVGHFQVPYLIDPNTGVSLFESASILDYLDATYAL
mmetsp:Transcript_19106/g.32844  ORF Transcript_19106/g.32844 Transcript_19106/m.32844 type:complete len:343 (-) Transcript_19106:68-1096(-)|eukprot:CAMPEP_0196667718 /NCGR_PEP_ID=MMETSP1086-20130531/65233_1 /TAXON_ID=77921 /ORGANISM="Cyanoptyche  gloeocystis , Strain SAG4.97" /LENGTH=342 /DNA_ID=CAMNT_0042005073 /DNA_START=54 /DNA_END=1082 /DNA_ORIENTATION=+